jgi:hypothetical protein
VVLAVLAVLAVLSVVFGVVGSRLVLAALVGISLKAIF